MSLVLIRLRTAVQIKNLTLKGTINFQIGLSNRKDSLLGDEVRIGNLIYPLKDHEESIDQLFQSWLGVN